MQPLQDDLRLSAAKYNILHLQLQQRGTLTQPEANNPEKRKISAAKAPFASFMQPLQYDLRSPAKIENNLPHTAAVVRNPGAATPLRSAEADVKKEVTWKLQFQCQGHLR